MKTRNELLVLAGLMLAWAGAASAELTLSWTGERQGVARAAVDGDTDSAAEADAGKPDAEATERTAEESQGVTREEYLAAVAWVEGEAAVDELSRRMVDGLLGAERDGDENHYGESTLPGGSADRVQDVVQMTRGGVVGTRSAGGGFSAGDGSGDAAYSDGVWVGRNGGTGFGEWRPKDGSAQLAVSTIDAQNGGFVMQAGANPGETAMMRSLDTDVGLTEGTFSVTMWGAIGGADEPGDFAGFAVYGSGDSELFRWGVGSDKNGIEGFVYRMGGENTYTIIEENLPAAEVDYTLTWELVGGKTRFTLSAKDAVADWSYFSKHEVDLGTSAQVMAIAVLLTESGRYAEGGDGSEMTFDNMKVTGTERAVPEPGVTGLLAAGLAALWGRRTKREK